VLVLLVSGCNKRQVVAGGGVGLTVLGLALTFSTETRQEDEVGTKGKVGITCLLGGLVVLFVAAAFEESATQEKAKEIKVAQNKPVDPDTAEQAATRAAQQKREQAWALTKQAQEAARTNDCAKVTELSAQVGTIDAEFYGEVFMKDIAIQHCFTPKDTPPAPTLPVVAPPTP
jgi:hypothetical protein